MVPILREYRAVVQGTATVHSVRRLRSMDPHLFGEAVQYRQAWWDHHLHKTRDLRYPLDPEELACWISASVTLFLWKDERRLGGYPQCLLLRAFRHLQTLTRVQVRQVAHRCGVVLSHPRDVDEAVEWFPDDTLPWPLRWTPPFHPARVLQPRNRPLVPVDVAFTGTLRCTVVEPVEGLWYGDPPQHPPAPILALVPRSWDGRVHPTFSELGYDVQYRFQGLGTVAAVTNLPSRHQRLAFLEDRGSEWGLVIVQMVLLDGVTRRRWERDFKIMAEEGGDVPVRIREGLSWAAGRLRDEPRVTCVVLCRGVFETPGCAAMVHDAPQLRGLTLAIVPHLPEDRRVRAEASLEASSIAMNRPRPHPDVHVRVAGDPRVHSDGSIVSITSVPKRVCVTLLHHHGKGPWRCQDLVLDLVVPGEYRFRWYRGTLRVCGGEVQELYEVRGDRWWMVEQPDSWERYWSRCWHQPGVVVPSSDASILVVLHDQRVRDWVEGRLEVEVECARRLVLEEHPFLR